MKEEQFENTETNLEDIINWDKEKINFYLEDVTSVQFIKDISSLIKRFSDKGAIKQAIEKLQSII